MAEYKMEGKAVRITTDLDSFVINESSIRRAIANVRASRKMDTTEKAYLERLAVFEGALAFLKGEGK